MSDLLSRRRFLTRTGSGLIAASAVGAAGLSFSRPSQAAVAAADLRFIFLMAQGGWDTTRVFTPAFHIPGVAMEADATTATVGNLEFVDHPGRPLVRDFFMDHHERMLLLQGMMVRSVAHPKAYVISMSGDPTGLSPDWPAIISSTQADRFPLPSLVLGGLSYPAHLSAITGRAGHNGQLEALLNEDIFSWSDVAVVPAPATTDVRIDALLRARAQSWTEMARSSVGRSLAQDHETSLSNALALLEQRDQMHFTTLSDLNDQVHVAVNALQSGICRCVTLGHPPTHLVDQLNPDWDSHANNDHTQHEKFNELFGGLSTLMNLLQSRPGHAGATMADETVVVVLSEMGRAPQLNEFQGKDHWPYTSAMILGPRLATNRAIGGLNSLFNGETIDLASGEIDSKGSTLTIESMGAGLLALADIDPGEWITHADPLTAMMG
jgi:hypothetical protein